MVTRNLTQAMTYAQMLNKLPMKLAKWLHTCHICAALQELIDVVVAAHQLWLQLLPQLVVVHVGAGIADDGHIARQEAASVAMETGGHMVAGSMKEAQQEARSKPYPCWKRNCSAG